ncbi:hypothetical protein D915_006279 [Fasciola hepatica]|uniref:C-type lectin domain-containing protein n=1 Tax=Fasciola hepatica TaxID=6192 RepID=A0A4E0RZR5_FASHE|nr:hypothetical protein D915_006279 [Fasciola hepatica]
MNIFAYSFSLMIALNYVNGRNFTSNNSLELHEYKYSYCKAHETCFSIGKTGNQIGYMVGEKLFRFISIVKHNQSVWLNLNALLHQTVGPNDTSWIYGEKIPTLAGQSMNDTQDIEVCESSRVALYTNDKHIRRTSTSEGNYSFVCEYRPINRTVGITRAEVFNSKSIILKRIHVDSEKSKGCFQYIHNISLLLCSFRCSVDLACRSMYHNSINSECIHAKYVDSLMAPDDWNKHSSGWKRFTRVNWSLAKVPSNET